MQKILKTGRKQQLGRAITILAQQQADEEIAHMDVSAWGAPSECHGVVAKGADDRYRRAYRRARAISGLTNKQFQKAIRQGYRGDTYVAHAVGRILYRECPFA